MTESVVLGIAGALALGGVLAGAGGYLYCRRQIGRLSRMLREAWESGQVQEHLSDTRESKLETQLRKLLRRSAALQENAQRDRESLAGLLADLSHQLRTPLSNVVMDADLLLEEGLSEEERRRFELHIREQAEKMQWLVSGLVKASRLEHGILHFEASRQEILPTLAMSVSAVYRQAQEKEISIVTDGGSAKRTLYHNRKWTAEAVTNILENAVKYSPRGSQIRIALEPLSLYTRIDIFDQGPGIPEEEYSRIFQRFCRGSHTDEVEGTGLGLYLAQVILAQEKGYVTAGANPEGGSCFSVFLLNEEPGRSSEQEAEEY